MHQNLSRIFYYYEWKFENDAPNINITTIQLIGRSNYRNRKKNENIYSGRVISNSPNKQMFIVLAIYANYVKIHHMHGEIIIFC